MRSGAGSTARGAAFLFSAQMTKFVVNLAGVVILSRFISPSEVGIATIGWAIVSAGEVLRDFGLAAAVVRSAHVSRETRDNLFWVNSVIGLVFALALGAVAPIIAFIFGLPALAGVLLLLAPVFLLNGLSTQYRADLNRRRRFRGLAIVDLLAPLAGFAVAVPAAIAGFGYWAIVVQYLTMALVTLVTLASLSRWLPRWPVWGHSVREYIGFGYRVALSQGMAYLGNNVDTLALGFASTSANVGYYSRGYQLSVSPLTQLRAPAAAIAVPTLAAQTKSPERFLDTLLRGQLLVGFLALPLAACMVAAHEPINLIALGPEWAPSAPVFAVLAVAGGLQSLSAVANWVFLTVGDGRALQRYSAVALIVKVALILPVAWLGALPVAWAYLASVILLWPLAIRWALRVANLPVRPVMLQGLRLSALSGVAAGVGLVASKLVGPNSWLALTSAVVGILAIYALASLIPHVRRDYRLVWHEVRRVAS